MRRTFDCCSGEAATHTHTITGNGQGCFWEMYWCVGWSYTYVCTGGTDVYTRTRDGRVIWLPASTRLSLSLSHSLGLHTAIETGAARRNKERRSTVAPPLLLATVYAESQPRLVARRVQPLGEREREREFACMCIYFI